MSESLEELLRQCAAKGCTHLTVYPVHSADNKITYWHARATPSSQHRYVHEIDTDIVVALTKVITTMPAAKKRAPPKKGALDLELTVAVTETELLQGHRDVVEPPVDMDESAERLSRLAEDAEGQGVGVTHSEALNLDDAFGDINQWLPKT